MKKTSSDVWQFFDRLEENKRCVAVLCKLCQTEFKYFGNTTNLRVHLAKKHPIQWELRRSTCDAPKTYDESIIQQDSVFDEQRTQPITVSLSHHNGSYQESTPEESNVSIVEADIDQEVVHQMHDNECSEEEWLEEEYPSEVEIYEPQTKRKKLRSINIKRETQTPPPQQNIYNNLYAKCPSKTLKTEHFVIDESQKDEYSAFGEYIANKLRKFRSPRTRGNVQQLITTIMWQAECGMYDDIDSVKKYLLGAAQKPSPVNHQEAGPTSRPLITIGAINQNSTMVPADEIFG